MWIAIHSVLALSTLLAALLTWWIIKNMNREDTALLKKAAWWLAGLTILTNVVGDFVYIYYRMAVPTSTRSVFLAKMPPLHKIWFEFKEHFVYFTIPLAIAAAILITYYGDDLVENKQLRCPVKIALWGIIAAIVIGGGLGIWLTTVKSVGI